ncbi:MAG: argininosuccinate lyase [Actinomycetota bacterium]
MSDERKMLWGGRFTAGPHPEMFRLTASTDVDTELLEDDLAVTKAHARTLRAAGLLEGPALAGVDDACDSILQEWQSGLLDADPSDEDVHSLVERELTDRLGDIGARIHAGRSRNDLVATDLRLWCRRRATELAASVADLIGALTDVAAGHTTTLMPGYTHLQRAQPVSLGFHLAAHGHAFLRDRDRLLRAAAAADVSPLGAGALAGTTLPLDPRVAAEELGFAATFANAMDAVSDRDFVVELVGACSLFAVHASRLAEEIVLWTSSEFGFARLAEEWSTGSSMMPQKRNPDLAELVRGRAGAAAGDVAALLALIKGLPLAYDRDLQEDKAIVFRAAERAADITVGMSALVVSLSFDVDRMAEAAGGAGTWATDVAEALVMRGVPFRAAHHAAGVLVARLEAAGLALAEAPAELLTACHPALTTDDRSLGDPRRSLEARSGPGGTSPERVVAQIEGLRAALS